MRENPSLESPVSFWFPVPKISSQVMKGNIVFLAKGGNTNSYILPAYARHDPFMWAMCSTATNWVLNYSARCTRKFMFSPLQSLPEPLTPLGAFLTWDHENSFKQSIQWTKTPLFYALLPLNNLRARRVPNKWHLSNNWEKARVATSSNYTLVKNGQLFTFLYRD